MSANKWVDYIKPRLDEIEMWSMEGVPQEEIAKRLDISYSKFRVHRKEHAELRKALSMTKGKVDAMVMKALRERAIGFKSQEELYEYFKDELTGERVEVKTQRKVRHIAGDVAAAKFWLEKRKPDEWGPNADGGGDGDGRGVVRFDET